MSIQSFPLYSRGIPCSYLYDVPDWCFVLLPSIIIQVKKAQLSLCYDFVNTLLSSLLHFGIVRDYNTVAHALNACDQRESFSREQLTQCQQKSWRTYGSGRKPTLLNLLQRGGKAVTSCGTCSMMARAQICARHCYGHWCDHHCQHGR